MSKKRFVVILLGLTPFLLGWLNEAVRVSFQSHNFQWILAVFFYACWSGLGFLSEDILDNDKQAVLFLNLPALFTLCLTAIQLIAGGFWSNPIGTFCRRFFFPAAFCFMDHWEPPFHPLLAPNAILPHIIAFLLMALTSFEGSHRRYNRSERGY